MLPFLKQKHEGSVAMPAEVIERDHDEGFDMLEAVASDILQALESKDKALLKEALSALCEHIQDLDASQDAKMGE